MARTGVYLGGGSRTGEFLEAEDPREIAAVFVYQTYATTMTRIMRTCAKLGIPVVADVTEWYTPDQLPNGRLGLPYWDSEFRLRVIVPQYKHVLCISSYLGDYFRRKGCHTIEVPPLFDPDEDKWRISENPHDKTPHDDSSPLRLVYAGTPGRKDLIGNVIRAVVSLRTRGRNVVLHCIGPTVQDIAAVDAEAGTLVAETSEGFVLHGRVPQRAVPAMLAQADFSIFVRPQARYAQAGFPTKLVESLAASVPVITNETGDIGRFVSNGREGIVIPDCSVTALVTGVEQLLREDRQHWREMRRCARECAMRSFDYREHSRLIGEFMEEIRSDRHVQPPQPAGVFKAFAPTQLGKFDTKEQLEMQREAATPGRSLLGRINGLFPERARAQCTCAS
jgi:glycosyltransferase involved in cell wall biosynthesis